MKKTLFAALLLGVLAQPSAAQQMSMPVHHSAAGEMPVGHSMAQHATQPAAQVSGAYVAAQPPTATDTAAFLVLKNTGKTPLVLTGASSPAAESAMLMRFVKLSNGQMSMKMVDSFTVAPGQSLSLTPGGNHLMLMGLKGPLKVGERLDLKLHFQGGGALKLRAPIKKF